MRRNHYLVLPSKIVIQNHFNLGRRKFKKYFHKEKDLLLEFFKELTEYFLKKINFSMSKFNSGKGFIVVSLYRQRGKYAKPLVHFGMTSLAGLGMFIAPIVSQEFPGRNVDPWTIPSSTSVLTSSTQSTQISTNFSENVRGGVIDYEVQTGDTVSSIAEKFGVTTDTIRWQNDLQSKDSIKVDQVLEIPPITGVMHTVKKGDTVYSIAKTYDVDPQVIVNYPFNTFANDETFVLAIGQEIMVPDGVKPSQVLWSPTTRTKQTTPDAGTVVASGAFVWPAGGTITQRFVWYHPGLDIANRAAPDILAADSGKVIVAGWPDAFGYGNRVILDHGNGYRTLYAHMAKIYVVPGQSVNRGNTIGKMGSTGRSTGTHLHFEVIQNGVHINPLNVLQ